jgi:hypothetical protein
MSIFLIICLLVLYVLIGLFLTDLEFKNQISQLVYSKH